MNLDDLIDGVYNKQKKTDSFSVEQLVEMVEGVVDSFDLLVERKPAVLKEEASGGTLTLSLKLIPDIDVSEIGWSDVKTSDDKETVRGPQRVLLEDYLSNIDGKDLSEKIESLSEFYKDGPSVAAAQGTDRFQVIQKVISYLVFYKTLTKVITNFNAASAGFTFESFLATLLKGQQIEANTGTIADFITGDRIPISLKLYAEGSLKVDGSYHDLVQDIVNPKYSHPQGEGGPHAMRYVVCAKDLSKAADAQEKLKQEGSIKFYQFDITLDNIMKIFAEGSPKAKKAIRLPKAILGQDANYDLNQALPRVEDMPSPEILEQEFIENVKIILGGGSVDLGKTFWPARGKEIVYSISDEDFKNVTKALAYATDEVLFKEVAVAPDVEDEDRTLEIVRGLSPLIHKELTKRLEPFAEDFTIEGANRSPTAKQVASIMAKANQAIMTRWTKTALKTDRVNAIEKMVTEGDFYTPEESRDVYADMGPEMKKTALLNSWGYLRGQQFHLGKAHAINTTEPVNAIYQGEIQIGTAAVVKMLTDIRHLLNAEVFEIFESLKNLSDHLNTYFSGGLSDDTEGDKAIKEAGTVGDKTTEVKALKPGGSTNTSAALWDKQSAGGEKAQPGGRRFEENKTREDIIE
tara:strand:- start:425 stop:2323 length:1899 start_codon:yes stop_codon:yes gene_type:complete